MNIYLGNTLFHQVEERLGYKLTEDDRQLWDKYHCSSADLSEKDSCFHIFDIPTCINVKGDEALIAIMKMFTPDKIVSSKGLIPVNKIK